MCSRSIALFISVVALLVAGAAAPAGVNGPFPFSPAMRTTCTARLLEPSSEFAQWQVNGNGVQRLFATAGATLWRVRLNNPDPKRASAIIFSPGPIDDSLPPPDIHVVCTQLRRVPRRRSYRLAKTLR